MTPRLVLDVETTGFPNNKPDGTPGRIIEVGAIVITEDACLVSPISFFVRQPAAHLASSQAQRAFAIHGIEAATILREGLDPEAAADRFVSWVARIRERYGVEQVSAWGQGFDFWFLQRPPWGLFERTGLTKGEDASMPARRGMGLTRKPSLKNAVEHANANGASIPWLSASHRAGEDARMAAALVVHFTELASQAG